LLELEYARGGRVRSRGGARLIHCFLGARQLGGERGRVRILCSKLLLQRSQRRAALLDVALQ
jgi:hypothetical protein